jgi:hypothetical protein
VVWYNVAYLVSTLHIHIYIVVLIIVAHIYIHHPVDTYVYIVGHRASGGLYHRSTGLLSQCVQYVLVVGVVVRLENAKNLGQVVGNQTPGIDFKVGFHSGGTSRGFNI